MVFYAIAKGKRRDIVNTWAECKSLVDGYGGAIFKKFETKELAEKFILDHSERVEIKLSEKIEGNLTSSSKNAFEILMNKPVKSIDIVPDYYVYTDGACSRNGQPGAVSGIGIYFGEGDPRNVSQRIEGKQTNNTAELGAILCLYPLIRSDLDSSKRVGIVTDSIYAIRCATTYGAKCEAEGWKKDIPNKAMVRQVYERYKYYEDKVKFIHVLAHTGATDTHSIGNACADKLAQDATQNA